MYEDLKGDVVTVLTHLGEMVGRLEQVTTNTVTIKDPRLFVPDRENQGGGFAPGVSMTGVMEPTALTIQLSAIVGILPSHDDVAKGWMQTTSGIVLQ